MASVFQHATSTTPPPTLPIHTHTHTRAHTITIQTNDQANGENNNDGESHNLSWNCGAEGPTGDPSVNRLRQRQMRNMAAALLLAHGVPMLQMGDEYGHSKVR